MKNNSTIHALLKVTVLFGVTALTGCPTEPGEDDRGTADSTTAETADTVIADNTTTMGPTTVTEEGPDNTSSTTSPETADTSSTTEPDDPFVFPTDPYDAYTQIDRHAAVEAGTAGILASAGLGFGGEDLSVRDMYNASNPADDEAAVWIDEIVASVTFFHDNLDDDLEALGLSVATGNQSLMQAGPVIVPDTIKYDPAAETAYPNGRRLEDQVVDITLAAVMLDLTVHPLDTFATLPLNPIANDVEFGSEFPYLAAPHAP